MAKKTITVSGKRYTSTGIRINPDDKAAYDAFLATLPVNTCVELTISARDLRQEWIDDWHNRAREAEGNGCVFIKHCRDTTIVAAYGTSHPYEIGLSAPRHGDKYDLKTGIAVAYAKTVGAIVPKFI